MTPRINARPGWRGRLRGARASRPGPGGEAGHARRPTRERKRIGAAPVFFSVAVTLSLSPPRSSAHRLARVGVAEARPRVQAVVVSIFFCGFVWKGEQGREQRNSRVKPCQSLSLSLAPPSHSSLCCAAPIAGGLFPARAPRPARQTHAYAHARATHAESSRLRSGGEQGAAAGSPQLAPSCGAPARMRRPVLLALLLGLALLCPGPPGGGVAGQAPTEGKP